MALLLAAFAGCNSGGSGDDDGDDDSSMIDGGAGQPDADPTSWETLIMGTWQLPAAPSEDYYCATKTLTETIYIGGFRPIAPLGTHHTVVSFGPGSGEPDNPGYKCGPGTENPQWIYASGVGTGELLFPDGIGVVLEAGTQVHINLHLFNATDGGAINGVSGVEFVRLDQAAVVHEAELFLAGPVQFNVPSGSSTQEFTCRLGASQTIFAIFPHMHQLGTHFKTEVEKDGVRTTIWDDDYDFETQEFQLIPQMTLSAGDKIFSTCTWNNPGSPVSFGDSSNQEMCFSILLRYPRLNTGGGLTGVICPF